MAMVMVFWPLVIVRWIHFTCVFAMFGSSLFWLYVGKERSSSGPGGLLNTLRGTNIMLRIAAPVAAISGVAWLASILINMAGDIDSIIDPEDLQLFFFETPFGTVSFVRLALLALGVVIAFLPWRGRSRFAALALVSALLLLTQAWFGHSAEGTGLYQTTTIGVYAIHTISAASWAGGFPALFFALVEQRRFGSPQAARECTLDICSRFSLVAMIAVTFVVLSGVATAGFRVEGFFLNLFDSSYGEVLFKKMAIIVAMFAVAYFNRFVAMPRLRATPVKTVVQITWLRYSLALDIVLGILVLGASAVLGIIMPPQ
jgi:putative copper resistance protein D